MSTHISGYSGIINSPVTTRSSTADWRANGAELMVRYDHNGLLASAQYAYTEVNGIKLQSTAPYQTVATENYLPRHNLSLLLGKRFKNEIEASLVFYAQSSTDWTQGDPEDSHERLDLRLAFPLIPNSLDLELVVQHPLGDYSEYYSFNKAEDRVFLKASFRF